MAKQSRFAVVVGGKAVSGVLAAVQAEGAVREATTGRVVTLPRVWAVAEGGVLREAASVARKATEGNRATTAAAAVQRETRAGEELGFYRKYTEGLLRRYTQMTMEAGRVSSVMGRDVLGGKASSYRITGFDDTVIFRLDVEKCLRRLDPKEREVIRRVAIQEYTHSEAADLIGISLRTLGTRYARAVDRLTGILLEARLLEPLRGCQVATM